jgi:hypothetical protein
MILKWLTCSLILSLLIFATAMAQSSDQQEPKKKETSKEALEKQALALLEEIAANSSSLKVPENRIYIQMEVGQLLWSRDEKRSRAIFKEIAGNFSEMLAGIDVYSPKYPDLFNSLNQMRMELVQTASQLDAGMALDLLRSTRPLLLNPFLDNQQQEETELQLEANLAGQMAASDPKKALELAKELLAKGLSPQLVSIIYQLQNKDREAAAKLASEVTAKILAENLDTNEKVRYIAYTMLTLLHSDQETTANKGSSPIVSEQIFKKLLDRLVTAALNISSSANPLNTAQLSNVQNSLMQLYPFLSDIEKYLPTRTPAIKAKIEKFKLSEEPTLNNNYNEVLNNGNVEAMLAAATKAPLDMRDYLYQAAAFKAANDGDTERARKILDENIENTFRRNDMLKALSYQMLPRITEGSGSLEQAYKIIDQFRSNEERVKILVQLALASTANGKKDNALQFLNQAWSLVSGKAEDYNQLMTQVEIASAYAGLQPEQSFAIIEPIIDQINELIPAAATLDGFNDGPKRFKEGELLLQPRNIEAQLTGLMDLVHTDLDRALSIADKFERNELRLLARLIIVQGALNYSEKKAQ